LELWEKCSNFVPLKIGTINKIVHITAENKQHIEVAVVGSANSGKTAFIEAISVAANSLDGIDIRFDEHHSHQEMDTEHHHVVLQVVDATNLRDSLQLTPSFIDHRHPLVLAVNRYDLLQQTGHTLNMPRFQELVGVPVVAVSSVTGEGIQQVLQQVVQEAQHPESSAHPIFHSWEQQDDEAYHAWMEGVLADILLHPDNDEKTWEEHINHLLIRPWTGFPILAILMGLIFWCTFSIGDPIGDWLDLGVVGLHDWCVQTLPSGWLSSMLGEGVILGVGSLLTALPNIIILFFFLSVMEDMGYMSRVAFLMDGVMHRVGLHGRSFIPMLMGFDCNVPAIMAARDIQNPKDRTLTMLMVPFMSCSARLPVYILFIEAFFPHHKAWVLASLYLLGILLSFAFAKVMKHTRLFRTPEDDSINELPDFRLPSASFVARHLWYRISDFLKKISTVVLCASIIIWALEYFPAQDLEHLDSSWLAAIGKWIEPIMRPLGMDWRLSVCLLTGLPAKEAIAATFAILFTGGVGASGMTGISAYAFLVFTLLYFPCVATISTIRRETSTWWAVFVVIHSIVVAWIMAFVVYQVGMLWIGNG